MPNTTLPMHIQMDHDENDQFSTVQLAADVIDAAYTIADEGVTNIAGCPIVGFTINRLADENDDGTITWYLDQVIVDENRDDPVTLDPIDATVRIANVIRRARRNNFFDVNRFTGPLKEHTTHDDGTAYLSIERCQAWLKRLGGEIY